MMVILSDDNNQTIGRKLYDSIKKSNIEVLYIATNGLDIKPCYSCGYCQTKEYGKCIHKDDMEDILRKVISAENLIIVTPLTWGSYSSSSKKVLDRLCIIGDSHYYMSNGEIIKGMVSRTKKMFAIGVKDQCSEEERINFERLLYENVNIMGIEGRAFVTDELGEIAWIIEEVCQ